jgi:RNA 2',3'-cyclic 3'-phosphodiesterase
VKTHAAAVVLIPPAEAWEPIQAIRRIHDEHLRRWMPHITLLYPFRPPEEWPEFLSMVKGPLEAIAAFELRLEEVRLFHHGPRSATVWVAPRPEERLIELQAALGAAAPDCDDVRRYPGGFTPHLSVGQARGGREAAERLRGEIERAFRPLSFLAREVSIIRRGEPPDDVFRVERLLPLKESGSPPPGAGGARP